MRTTSDIVMALILITLSSVGLQIMNTGGNDAPILLTSISLATWLSFRLFS